MPGPEGILRRQPFAAVATLARVEPLAGEESHSGGALLAHARDGRRFKLRVCPSQRRARDIESLLRALPDFFPRLLDRRGPLLLMEWLEGERVEDRKQLRRYARQLGRVYARIHRQGRLAGPGGRLRAAAEALRIRLQFARQLRALRRLDAGLARDLLRLYRAWRREFGIPIALELRDVHKANFVVDAEGALRYVDEEGLMYAMRGMGLGKLLADPGSRPGSPKRTREWYRFCEGYAEEADAAWLTPEYCAYARMLELVRSVEFKLRSAERLHKVDEELAELRELVGPEVKRPPGPSDPGFKRESRSRDVDQPA